MKAWIVVLVVVQVGLAVWLLRGAGCVGLW